MKRNVIHVFLSLLLALAFACNRSHETHSQARADEADHQHQAHGDTTTANEHMHRTDFETLVNHFEDPERNEWQKPQLVMDKMGDLSAKTVADIGAGSGYFSFRLARKAEKVIAIDIDQRFLNYIKEKKASLPEGLPLETRLAEEDDPHLAPNEADIVLLVNTYHHINNRPQYFAAVRKDLKPGGFLMVVDFKKQDSPMGPPLRMKLAVETVIDELKKAGFTDISVDQESLKYQYIVKTQ